MTMILTMSLVALMSASDYNIMNDINKFRKQEAAWRHRSHARIAGLRKCASTTVDNTHDRVKYESMAMAGLDGAAEIGLMCIPVAGWAAALGLAAAGMVGNVGLLLTWQHWCTHTYSSAMRDVLDAKKVEQILTAMSEQLHGIIKNNSPTHQKAGAEGTGYAHAGIRGATATEAERVAAEAARRLPDLQALGLGEGATDAEIRSAYRRLAIRLHPDKGGDEEAFKALANAYQRLEPAAATAVDKTMIEKAIERANKSIISCTDLLAKIPGRLIAGVAGGAAAFLTYKSAEDFNDTLQDANHSAVNNVFDAADKAIDDMVGYGDSFYN